MAPATLLFIGVLIIPIIYGFYLSFCDWNGVTAPVFTGLKNYIVLFTMDQTFWIALKNSLFFVVTSLIFQQLLGLGIALVLTNGIKFRNVFKNVFYFPAVLSGTAVGLMWGFIFNFRLGAINAILNAVGLGQFARMWLVETKGIFPLPMWCITFVAMWQFSGAMMMLFMTSILQVPSSIMESARIDGATRRQCIRYITMPLIRPIFRVTMVMSCVGSLKFFDLIYTMTGGGPSHLTDVLATHMYTEAFTNWRYGFGNAIAVILVLLCLLATFIINKAVSSEDYELQG